MNSAKDALKRASQLNQAPSNKYRYRRYSTSDEAHALLAKTAKDLGLTIRAVLQTLIMDALSEPED